jgi:hypothetical protein
MWMTRKRFVRELGFALNGGYDKWGTYHGKAVRVATERATACSHVALTGTVGTLITRITRLECKHHDFKAEACVKCGTPRKKGK